MNSTCVLTKTMTSGQMSTEGFVPSAGEIIIDPSNNNCKIGDGITELCALPWIALHTDVTTNTHEELSERARKFIESNIEYIEANDYETLYSHITTVALAQEVTRALLKADLDPTPYLSHIPECVKHLLGKPDVYTQSEIDEILYSWNNKLFPAMSIPDSIIKVGV